LNLFNNIAYYFSVYKKYLGYRLYVVFLLTGLAAATEGVGIAFLLPLIELTDAGAAAEDASGVTAILQRILDIFGIGQSVVGILMFIGLVFLLKGILKFAEGGYKYHLQAQLVRDLKTRMFDYYGGMDYRYYIRHNTGHFINILNGQIRELVTSFDKFKIFTSAIITTVAYLAFAFMIHWQFAAMAVVVGILILTVFQKLNTYVRNLSRKAVREQSVLNKFLVQTLQSFKYIQSTAQIKHLRKSVMGSIGRLTGYIRNQGIADALTKAVKEPVSVFLILGIIAIQVTFLSAQIAPLFVALILIHRAIGHIVTIQSSWQATMSKIGALEIVEEEFRNVSRHQEPNGSTPVPPLRDRIELSNVSFSYNSNATPVLHNITVTIKANTTVAFVGASGAGKTTLIDLLTLMLRPREGAVLIDGIHHGDIEVQSWRRQIGYVSQDTVMFDDTIANNICLWNGDYNRSFSIRGRIESAAEQASIREFIEQLPDGFNTVVGDRGMRLSGGQRQRLFIARELFKEPRFLILDEATSALDTNSERYIQESIDRLKGSTTVVIISHRLSTIRYADHVFVLEAGRIVEHGSYDDLMSSNGTNFKKMATMQSL
jgi:ABC-type multidrug transport system fused ATPase/permease subunit